MKTCGSRNRKINVIEKKLKALLSEFISLSQLLFSVEVNASQDCRDSSPWSISLALGVDGEAVHEGRKQTEDRRIWSFIVPFLALPPVT